MGGLSAMHLLIRAAISLLLIVITAACGTTATPPPITLVPAGERPPSRFTDPELIEGEYLYNLACGHCHGYELQGQLAASIPQTELLGMHIVPPHDETGHTWMHPDQLLIRAIREGIPNPLQQYPMPAFGDAYSDAQINAILRYIRFFWTEEQREHNRRVTEQWAAIDQQFASTESATSEASP